MQPRRKHGGFFTRGILVLFAFAFVFMAWNVWDIYQKAAEAHQKAAELTRQLDDLEARKKELAATLEKFGTRDGLEAEVRQTLQVAKPGEKVIVLVDQQPTSTDALQSAGFWAKIGSWLGL